MIWRRRITDIDVWSIGHEQDRVLVARCIREQRSNNAEAAGHELKACRALLGPQMVCRDTTLNNSTYLHCWILDSPLPDF